LSQESLISTDDRHQEFRRCHRGGAVYLGVESLLWLLSATLGVVGHVPAAMLTLLLGGMSIHPVTMALSRALGWSRPGSANPLGLLSMWIALTIPLGLPLVFLATSGGRNAMFYPAFAILVGAHWLPFAYVYSMPSFVVLAIVTVIAGIGFGFVVTASFATCGFVVAGIFAIFAVVHYAITS